MEVNSVAIGVIQKLKDMLTYEESIIGQEAIVDQLNEIRNGLEKLRKFYMDEEDKTGEGAIEWAAEYLQNLYYVEDTIETFALRIYLRKRRGFLLNHALFLKNFTAYKKLKRKIAKIKKKIIDLQDKKLIDLEEASLRASSSRSDDIDKQSYDDDDDDNEMDRVAEIMMIAPVRTSTPIQKKLSSPRSDVSLTVRFQEHHKPVSRSPSEISSDRPLHEHHKPVDRWNSQTSTDRALQSKYRGSYSYRPEELGLVGFRNYIDELKDHLTGGDNQIIPLVGEKGSGKTTLAHTIRVTKEVKDYFQTPFVWVTIDEESTAEDILFNLLKQVGGKDQDPGVRASLIDRLKEILEKDEFFIVLDDLRKSDTWGEIKNAFVDIKKGTKIIITTRDKKVADSANISYSLHLKGLNDEDTLRLFEMKAGLDPLPCPEELKQKILDICKGLPLNVVLLGSLLHTKASNDWKTLLAKWQTSLAKWQTLPDMRDWQKSGLLALSYNDTSDEEKLCLLYMVLFPKEYDIPVRRLLRLWFAEGFIKRPVQDENQNFPEDNVEKCFKSLLERSLILITNQRSDGGNRKCRLLGGLHEYLFPKAIDIELFHVRKSLDRPTDDASMGARRLVEFVDGRKCSKSLSSKFRSKLRSKLKSRRSYLAFNLQKKDTPAREVGVVLSNMLTSGFSLLRVLDLEGVYKPSLPDNLGNFVQLRYLGLRWTFLDSLPSSVGDLTYLETLDLKHTNVNSLPASVWKLKNLRHLNLNDIRLDIPVTSNHSLPELLTLCGLSIVEGECKVKGGLDRLLHLRELDLTFQLGNSGELLDWVSKLTSLEQLRLRSKDDLGRPSTLHLKSLASLEKLSHMNFLGKLPKLLEQKEFPQYLKVLTFSQSELQNDPMQILGHLEHLTVLRLLAKSYLGTKISCPQKGFQELRVLKLWMLPNLEDWELGEECMEKLNELSIRCCDKLKSVPKDLLEQRSFKELILNNMPKEFEEQSEQQKARHVSVIVKNYDFTPLPWEQGGDCSEIAPSSAVTSHANGCSTSGSERQNDNVYMKGK